MSITYPLDFPTNVRQPAAVVLRPVNVIGMNRSPFSGSQQTVEYSGKWWEADIDLPPMRDDDSTDEWKAFLAKLNGRKGTFLMGDPSRALPKGSAASTPGTPVVNGADQTGHELDITGMPTSVTGYLKRGDYIQLGSGSASRLHILLDQLDTDSSGEGTAVIWPTLRTSPNNGATVTVIGARGLFRLTDNIEWGMEPGTVFRMSFAALEVV